MHNARLFARHQTNTSHASRPRGANACPSCPILSVATGLRVALFDHMIKMGRRSVPEGTDLVPRASLNVEYTQQQQRLINPRSIDYTMHEIAKHAHGEDAKQAMARRKLDNLGYVRGECGLANDPDRIQRLKNQLSLTESLAAISKEAAEAKAATASLESARLIELAPDALKKLREKGADLNKITKADMCAIAFKHFGGAVLKGDKAAHIKELAALMGKQPEVMRLAAPTLHLAEVLRLAAPTPAAPPPLALLPPVVAPMVPVTVAPTDALPSVVLLPSAVTLAP